MSKKLNCILLVDDNEFDNFFHQRVIEQNHLANTILVKQSATEALDYLKAITDSNQQPDLIFLDINMPKVDGWEFLEAYRKLVNKEDKSIIVMLTTSENPNDVAKARTFNEVAEFRSKPLTKEMYDVIIAKHFPDNV